MNRLRLAAMSYRLTTIPCGCGLVDVPLSFDPAVSYAVFGTTSTDVFDFLIFLATAGYLAGASR